jgi:hypothetical protein
MTRSMAASTSSGNFGMQGSGARNTRTCAGASSLMGALVSVSFASSSITAADDARTRYCRIGSIPSPRIAAELFTSMPVSSARS